MKPFLAFLILVFSIASLSLHASEIVKLKGKIGTYEIEIELEKSDDEENGLKGRYKYQGKNTYLTLEGNLYDTYAMVLTEFSKGKSTGEFYLEVIKENTWSGYWLGEKVHYDVLLEVVSGDISQLQEVDFEALSKTCNSSITGSYATETYFINDMWLEENGSVEMGFNGGLVTIQELDSTTIKVKFELLCGPTYHLAYFDGKAVKDETGNYIFDESMYEEDENCHLIFSFKEKELKIVQKSAGMNCDFGARAYADGEFVKINDKLVEGEEITIDDAIKLK